MKRWIVFLAVVCLAGACACGETSDALDAYTLQMYGMTRDDIAKGLKIASVSSGFSAEAEEEAWRRILSAELQCDLRESEIVRWDVPSFADAVLLLAGEKLDIMEAPLASARYVAARNPDIGYLDDPMYTCDLSMVFASKDTALWEAVNRAIADMRADGALQALRARYIDPAAQGDEPEPVRFSQADYAQTLRVGVSGGMPPYDYTTASDEPAGYNMAFLNELSARMRVNIQLVFVSGGAYQLELASGRLDAYFCYFTEGSRAGGSYTPNISGEVEALAEHLLFSDAYESDTFCLLMAKPRAERARDLRAARD